MVAAVPMVWPEVPVPGPTQTKSILRRATPASGGIISKKVTLEFDSSPLSSPQSPNKRRRVSFNPIVLEKSMGERAVSKSLEAARAEVKVAIEAHNKGSSEAYDELKELFAPRSRDVDGPGDANPENLKTYILALTSFASLLDRNCSGLIRAILGCEWLGRDEAFVKAYIHFLGNLASAQGSYVSVVLGMLVDNFVEIRLSSGCLPGYLPVGRDVMSGRVHSALKYILRLIPSGAKTLSSIFSTKFPFPEDSKKMHMSYVNNLVRVIEYAPQLKLDILALITDRLVKIDVQMQVDLEDLDDEVAATIVQALSSHPSKSVGEENGDDASDDSDANSDYSDDDIAEKRIKEIQENVEKMDATLDLLFTIYEPYFKDPNSREASTMFDTLRGHFANIILPTYRSRHTQFLLFHFGQSSEHLVDEFTSDCLKLTLQPGRPAILRQSSAAYLASFVARGSHVQPHFIRKLFGVIGTKLDSIRLENEDTCRGPDLQRYGTFYAMMQALLYIFCFRWRDLINDSESLDDQDPSTFSSQELEWAPRIKETLTRLIYSKLNPLKVCSPAIVMEFAKIAHHLRFMYVFPLLEANKRIRLNGTSAVSRHSALRDAGNGVTDETWHQLEAYFPFDPYQLPISKRWIENDYVPWTGIPGLHQDEDDGDESDEEE
ncbi:RNA polymerase I-specific transcription initiation factor-like protein rrn3 [Xylogone sp. PMI_703]|nr:RNA polymerase I-specific transcription initiation factor-like protein rrn3 [Xylogone sp. PMI_703]